MSTSIVEKDLMKHHYHQRNKLIITLKWRDNRIQTLGQYHDLHLQSDTLQLR